MDKRNIFINLFTLVLVVILGIGGGKIINNTTNNANTTNNNANSSNSSCSEKSIETDNAEDEPETDYDTEKELYDDPEMSYIIQDELEDDPEKNVNIHDYVEENDSVLNYDYDFDWNSYSVNDDGYRFFIKDDLETDTGISVSYYQQDIDWKKVKEQNIDYAIIRIGYRGMEEGNIHEDPKFEENINGALENGIKVGVYFFSQAKNKEELDEEIKFILSKIEEYKVSYPIGINLDRYGENSEYSNSRISDMSDDEYIDMIKYFAITIANKGYIPIVYNTDEEFGRLPENALDGCLKWVYSGKGLQNVNNCAIWQYRNYYSIDGIDTKVSISFSAMPFING